MSRSKARTSRALIGILVVAVVLGLVSYIHNTSKSKTREADAAPVGSPSNSSVIAIDKPVEKTPAPTVTQAPVVKPDPQSDVMVTSTPTIPPATRPSAAATVPPVTIALAETSASVPPEPAAPTGPPLVRAQALIESGKLLEARKILNTTLITRTFSASDANEAKKLIGEINQTLVFSSKRFPDDPFGGTHTVGSGETLQKIGPKYDVPWTLIARLNDISDPRRLRAAATLKVLKGPFHALVDKSDFTLEMWIGGKPMEPGSMFVRSFPVGLGADNSTPPGVWMVEPSKKLMNPTYYSPRGEGIIEGDDPTNPLGERWIGLSGIAGHAVGQESYGIHGTIEPESIGKMESMGCIRLLNDDVMWVYDMLAEGKSTVTVQE